MYNRPTPTRRGKPVPRPSARRTSLGLVIAAAFVVATATGVPAGAAPTPKPSASPPAIGAAVPPEAPFIIPGLDPRLVGAPLEDDEAAVAAATHAEAVRRAEELRASVGSLGAERDRLDRKALRLQARQGQAQRDLRDSRRRARALGVASYKSQFSDDTLSVLLQAQSMGELARQSKYAGRVSALLADEMERSQRALVEISQDLDAVQAEAASVRGRLDDATRELPRAEQAAQGSLGAVEATLAGATVSGLDIPLVTLDAYLRAERVTAAFRPTCGLAWWGLAGIGRVESNHGRFGGAHPGPDGTESQPIIGAPLDGTGVGGNTGAILAPVGAPHGDPVFDHAMGPMQFISGTWNAYQADGNGDGVKDPQNVYDAALAAAAYLCTSARGQGLSADPGLRVAYLAYNHSAAYVADVLEGAHRYRDVGLAGPASVR